MKASRKNKSSKRAKIESKDGLSLGDKITKLGSRSKSRAKLSLLPSLPLDILYEIFGNLPPIDILHLARTTKELRRLLMQKSAMSVWKASFSLIPSLPECPEDMSYPAWAHLVFEPVCHNCSATNVRNTSWLLRMRLCTHCAKTCLQDIDTLEPGRHTESDDETAGILRCTLPFTNAFLGADCFLISDRKQLLKELWAHRELETLANFILEKQTELDRKLDHAYLCEDWAETLAGERAKELEVIRTERRNAISKKLAEMGYAEELVFLDKYDDHRQTRSPDYPAFDKHPLVRQPRPLKDKAWDSIKDKLKDYMEIVKNHRITAARQALIWVRRESASLAWFKYRNAECNIQDLLPNQIDIWLWKPVIDVIEQPSEVIITENSFEQAFRGLPSFIKKWQEDKMDQLLRIAHGVDWIWRPGVDDLQRATCVFSCSQEYFHEIYSDANPYDNFDCMWFPEFIHHRCNALARYGYSDDGEGALNMKLNQCKMVEAPKEGRCLRRRQWSTRWLSFNEKGSRTVKNILNACGLPMSTTVEQLDQADPRLVCLKCSFGAKCDGERPFSVMTWRTAVEHNLKKHFGDGQTTFQRISTADVYRAKILEKAEPARRLAANPNYLQKPTDKPWRCGLCKDDSRDPGPLSLVEMRNHHDSRHDGENDIEEGTHYYRAFERGPPQPYPVRMKAEHPEDYI